MEDENKSSRMRGWNGCTHKEGKLWGIDNRERGGRGGEGAVVVEGMTRVPVICLQASRLKTNSYFYQGNYISCTPEKGLAALKRQIQAVRTPETWLYVHLQMQQQEACG